MDELRLMVYPLVLGAGDRLFGETQDKLRCASSNRVRSGQGLVIMIYAPAT